MNEGLFQQVRSLDLPQGKHALFGSASLSIRNIRPSNDIDIIVTDDVWEEYSRNADWEMSEAPSGNKHLKKGDIEMTRTWAPGAWDVAQLIAEAEIIDGLPFVRLETVLEWKRRNGREKDLKDVSLIEDFMKRGAI